ncbi:hypothetical protein B0H14DRAFT_208353 [Mycena olivaceomarginata]|nr:hypothetical protein B0H14DRAFT_208353 [Mycena olivaceomarginata]
MASWAFIVILTFFSAFEGTQKMVLLHAGMFGLSFDASIRSLWFRPITVLLRTWIHLARQSLIFCSMKIFLEIRRTNDFRP